MISLEGIGRLLLPAEDDEGFRRENTRTSLLALRLIGALELSVPLVLLAAGVGVIPVPNATANLALSAVGAISIAASWLAPERPRALAVVSIWMASAVVAFASAHLAADLDAIQHYLLGYFAMVMIGAAAAVPFLPLHTLVLGLAINGIYAALWINTPLNPVIHVLVFLVTLLGTALTAVVHRKRLGGYEDHRQALRAAEALRVAQSRLLISESAATLGRIAAALSHELNSPIGVLVSSLDTATLIAAKQTEAGPEERRRYAAAIEDLHRAGTESAERLRQIVARMQRFTNLDRADVQPANLNELLNDVLALHAPELDGKATVEREFGSLPRFTCRPQQLSAVFSNLLENALGAVGTGGHIRVSTHHQDNQIQVRFTDDGRGMNPEEVAAIFDPASFRVAGARMAAGNWSMFSCRQIVHEHGGEIAISSAPGSGTAVTVTLPL